MTVTLRTCRRHGGQFRRLCLLGDPNSRVYRCALCDLERRRQKKKKEESA